MAERKKKSTTRDLATMVFRRQAMFIVCAGGFALLALVGVHYLPVEYSTVAKFERRVDDAMASEGMLRGVGGRDALENIQMTLIEELGSSEAIEDVARKLGLVEKQPTTAAASSAGADQPKMQRGIVSQIRKGLDIRWDVQSHTVDMVSVNFTFGDRELAYLIPNALIDRYVQNASSKNRRRLEASRDFLREQVRNHDQEYQKIYAQRVELETQYVGLLEGVQPDIIRRQQQSKADLDAVRRLRDIARTKYASLLAIRKQQTEPTTQPVQVIKGPNPELERLGNELRQYKVELDLAMTLQHMTTEHPAIQTLLSRIRIMEERIRNTPTEIVLQRIYGSGSGADNYAAQVAAAQSEAEILSGEYDRIESQIVGYEKMMTTYEPARRTYTMIMGKLQDAQTTTENWRARLRDVEMALNAEMANRRTSVSSVEPAKRPESPSFPRFPQVLALALVGGLLFGGTIVFAVHSNDRSVLTVEDATDHFQVPVHGVIGEVLTEPVRVANAFKRRFVLPAVGLLLLVAVGVGVISINLRLNDPDRFEKWKSAPGEYTKTVLLRRLLGS